MIRNLVRELIRNLVSVKVIILNLVDSCQSESLDQCLVNHDQLKQNFIENSQSRPPVIGRNSEIGSQLMLIMRKSNPYIADILDK